MNEIKTEMVRRAATNVLYQIDEDAFDAWLASHDQAIRDEVTKEVMHEQWPTPKKLIQAAWDRSYSVPGGRTIPARTPILIRNSCGLDYWPDGLPDATTIRPDAIYELRILSPLPPVIPEGTQVVRASTKDCDVRRPLVATMSPPGAWRDGDGDVYHGDDLIDPIPTAFESEARS